MSLIYTGNRYVPKICGEHDKTKEYEPLCIVTWQGASYTSKKIVPKNIEITNADFWVLTGDYNSQVAQYKTDLTNKMNDIVQKINDELATQNTNVETTVNNSITQAKTEINKSLTSFKNEVNENIDNFTTSIANNINNFENNINTNVNNFKDSVSLKTKLASNVYPEFKTFIDYTPTDTTLLLQGSCLIDNSNMLIAFTSNNTTTEKGNLILYNYVNNEVVEEYKNISIWHGNDFAYDSAKNELWCASMYASDIKSITILDYSTLALKNTITYDFVDGYIMGVCLMSDYYIICTINTIYYVSYDSHSLIKTFSAKNIETSCQGIELYKNKYILFFGFYKITVFDLDGNIIKVYDLPRNPEYEGLVGLNDGSYLLTHRNYGIDNREISIRSLDIMKELDTNKISFFTSLGELGILQGSEYETIENICSSMGDNSLLIYNKTASNTSTCYPAATGFLKIRRIDRSKVELKFTEAGNNNCNVWIGNYNKNLSVPFSGWKKIITQDSAYRILDFYDLGLTPDSFTTNFADNVLLLISKIGKGKQFHTFVWNTQSNTNLYNSIKTWCGINCDSYDLKIETSFIGNTNHPNKIIVTLNSNDGNNTEIYGYYDNELGNPNVMVSLAKVNELINNMKNEILTTCNNTYQKK